MKPTRAWIPILLLATLPLAAGQEPDDQDLEAWEIPDEASAVKNPLTASPDTLREGRALWAVHCLDCHGAAGRGDGPHARLHERRKGYAPRNLTERKVQENLTDGDIFYRLSHGIVEKDKGGEKVVMPAFESKTTEAERWRLVLWVRELGKPAGATTGGR